VYDEAEGRVMRLIPGGGTAILDLGSRLVLLNNHRDP
jgi:hypothetical protein